MEMESLRYEAADVSVSLSGCGRYLDLNPGKTKEHCATLSGTGRPTWKEEGEGGM